MSRSGYESFILARGLDDELVAVKDGQHIPPGATGFASFSQRQLDDFFLDFPMSKTESGGGKESISDSVNVEKMTYCVIDERTKQDDSIQVNTQWGDRAGDKLDESSWKRFRLAIDNAATVLYCLSVKPGFGLCELMEDADDAGILRGT